MYVYKYGVLFNCMMSIYIFVRFVLRMYVIIFKACLYFLYVCFVCTSDTFYLQVLCTFIWMQVYLHVLILLLFFRFIYTSVCTFICLYVCFCFTFLWVCLFVPYFMHVFLINAINIQNSRWFEVHKICNQSKTYCSRVSKFKTTWA